jgi:hypothetical protein
MTFEELPKFRVDDILRDDGTASVAGHLVGPIQVQANVIACLYVASGRFVWGRFTSVHEQERSAVLDLEDFSDRSAVVLGQQYPYLDGYWGERAELVHDTSRRWVRIEFHPRDLVENGAIVPGGSEHEHCGICWEKIAEYAQPFGYHDQRYDWVCERCYDTYVVPKCIDFISLSHADTKDKESL